VSARFIAKGGVLLACGENSSVLASRWPDIVVGVVIAGVFLVSALGVPARVHPRHASTAGAVGRQPR